MDYWQACLILCPAAAIGGAINAVAGGGTLITFPALMWVLSTLTGNAAGSATIANATSTVALCPGSFTGAWGYRRELAELWKQFRVLALPSLIGGAAGSLIVVKAPEESFNALVPWLIGVATLLFILQPRLVKQTASADSGDAPSKPGQTGLVMSLQFLIALYGGYFGAGIGILMLSSLSLMVRGNIHQVNGLKTILAGLINAVSVVIFVTSGTVNWSLATPMLLSSALGGWLGATWARRLDRMLVRRIVIAIGITLTAWYFLQQFTTA